jgi:alpha-beta hydrolase superfamily lysophospholipase
MRRRAWTYGPIPLALAVLTGGCTVDHYARAMVHQNTLNGRVRLWLLGSGETMLRQGRIDAHRRIAGFDGTEIDTWVIRDRRADRARRHGQTPVPPTRGTAVLLHGLLDSKARFFGLGQRLANRGFHVVLPDHRLHGRSGGECVTYGAKEKRDVRAVVDALLADETVAEPIYVFGFSMGAAVAVEYAAIDDRVRGVMSCAPYADLRSMTRRVGWWLGADKRREMLARAGEIAGFDPAEVSPEAAAARLSVPLLVVHGTWDPIVPYKEGLAVYQAASGPKRMITIPRMGHVSLLLGREAWFADRFAEIVAWSHREDRSGVKDR